MRIASKSSLLLCLSCSLLFGAKAPVEQKKEPAYIYMHVGGRLGNQMFQVAAALSLAHDFGAQAIFPDLAVKSVEDIPLNHKVFFSTLNTKEPPSPPRFFYTEHPHFQFTPIPFEPNMEISGYFQSEKYFKHNKEKICAFFEPSEKIKQYLMKRYRYIIDYPNTVGIHMRAYKMESLEIEKCFPFLTGKFFMRVASLFPDDALFIIFSDRIDWAKKELEGFERPHIFIENEPHYHDFYLMSMCKHQILSPSSFGWWAAYLNKNPDKIVVAPYPWFSPISGHDSSNVIPEDWYKVPWMQETSSKEVSAK